MNSRQPSPVSLGEYFSREDWQNSRFGRCLARCGVYFDGVQLECVPAASEGNHLQRQAIGHFTASISAVPVLTAAKLEAELETLCQMLDGALTANTSAGWQVRDPAEPWCPPALRRHLGFALDYQDVLTQEAAAADGWRFLAGSKRGRAHAHQGAFREDAFAFATDRGMTFFCVSDGAGSSAYSRIGAENTCREVRHALQSRLANRGAELRGLRPNALLEEMRTAFVAAVQSACDSIHRLAKEIGSPSRDFYCTLIAAVLLGDRDAGRLFFIQIGDGFLAVNAMDGSCRCLGMSEPGLWSGEVVCFIPEGDAVTRARQVQTLDAAAIRSIIAGTDGIEDPFYPLQENASAIFAQLYTGVSDANLLLDNQPYHGPVLGTPEAGERLRRWLSFEKRGENDDRTLAILYRDLSGASGSADAG